MRNVAKPHHQKIWRVRNPIPPLCRILSQKLNISEILAQLLVNRRIYTVEQARAFLGSDLERLHDPLLLPDMGKAVKRILKTVYTGEKILIYGDYDADGITATVLLLRVLRSIDANVDFYIPNRLKEGYGVHLEGLKKARENGTGLVVTVDCGINAVREAQWAKENGLVLIITDHHEPPPELPEAFAVINPKRQDSRYPFKYLSGAGIALKLAQALLASAGTGARDWQEHMDLACVGTVADIVPMLGENRILVKHGLTRLANTCGPGLQALMAVSGINREKLGPREIGFGLAPRLNAAGRIGSPETAVNLLLTENIGEAWELANQLDKENQIRQKIETDVFQEALKMLEERPELGKNHVIVLASENWHPGVIGIVASRILDHYHRPVLLIALEGEEGKGSARSIQEFNIYKALTHCQKYLIDYGGHSLAAGFSIRAGDVDNFRADLLSYAAKLLGNKKLLPKLELDCLVKVEEVSEKLVNEIALLEPFGQDNPDPLLGCLSTFVTESRIVGKDSSHLKLRLRGVNTALDGIGFNLGSYAGALATSETVDLAFVPGINEFNGRRSVQLDVKDLGVPAIFDLPKENREDLIFEDVCPDPQDECADNSSELFIPEFVLRILKNLKGSGEKELGHIKKKSSKDFNLMDLRNTVERTEFLLKITDEGEPSLVITTCGYQAVEVAHFLQLERPSLKKKTSFYHGSVSGEKKSMLIQMFKRGELRAVVTTPEILGSLSKSACRVLLYNLPYNPEAVYLAINALKPGGTLYLLYSAEDLQDNIEGLDAMAPDRSYLTCFYKKLFQILRCQKDGRMKVDIHRIARVMAEAGFPNCHEYSAEAALIVMKELELITINREGRAFQVELCPRPTQKRDLVESQTYRHLHQIKEESIAWMRKFLDDNFHNIL